MMDQEKYKLLSDVINAVDKDPNFYKDIVNACQYGIQKKLERAYERAADFETIAVAMNVMYNSKRATPKTKDWVAGIIASKYEKWVGKTSINWDKLQKAFATYNERN